MSLKNDRELANTREKLRLLEEEYDDLRNDLSEDERVRSLSMRSLKRLINQLNEEIVRYGAHQPAQQGKDNGRRLTRLESQREVDNTREKLRRLEAGYEELRAKTGGDEELHAAERESLKRLINQLKEEIVLYEIHQPAQR